MTNPYEVLGVERDADLDTIKAAFRAKAKEFHPDRAGNAKMFDQVNLAYEVLRDPDVRRRYDETGEIVLQKDSLMSIVACLLDEAMGCSINRMIEEHRTVQHTPITKFMAESLVEAFEILNQNAAVLAEAVMIWGEISERMGVSQGDNIMSNLALRRLSEVQQQLLGLKKQREALELAQDELRRYSYRVG